MMHTIKELVLLSGGMIFLAGLAVILLSAYSERFKALAVESLKTLAICAISSAAMVLLSLLYLVFPLDLVPDFIPVAGQVDDVAMLVLGLLSIPGAAVCWIGRTGYLAVRTLGKGKEIDK